MSTPLLTARGLRKTFPTGRDLLGRPSGGVRAVDGVDLDLAAGETVGVVGESGSGKTTVGRLVSRLAAPDAGRVELDGRDITRLRGRDLKRVRRDLQVIFQDPYGSLDPTKTVEHAVAEPLAVHRVGSRAERSARVAGLLEQVALDPAMARRYPDELSGGQRQRVAIARAMALSPRVLVADEPTSALDLSTRSEILNLLLELQAGKGLATLLISHDFATVRHLTHRIVVMYLGRVVEEGDAAELVASPLHPYTKALLSAVPEPDPVRQRGRERIELRGEQPDPANPPSGCRFRGRCPQAMARCAEIDPVLTDAGDGPGASVHRVACLLHEESK
ncbi:ABC transporter ATP-binding protein [Actinomadura rugatobispora]|uniref:ABC transporter ATP-binding protein n=1 Tax=Actinomadura rugatobispora TaxID=1994 RepID=A0ABW1A6D2_9ACTN|nr:ATP-binding cassette domain-containing protein [Actinomadura rugatobispora]